MAITTRKYRCLDPIANESLAIEILFKRNQLWNQLIELFRRYLAEAEALKQAETPRYAHLTHRYLAIEAEITELVVRKKASRRKSSPVTAEERARVDAGIASARAEKQAVVSLLKSARAAAKPSSKDRTDAIWQRFREEQKRLCHASGLWWGNHETVSEAFESACRSISKGGGLNFHRFDGTGMLRVRESSTGVTLAAVLAGSRPLLCIDEIPDAGAHRSARGQQHVARHTLTMRIDMAHDDNHKKRSVDIVLPVILHRPLAGTQFKYATIRRERTGRRFSWYVVFTCGTDEAMPSDTLAKLPSGRAALNFGWRQVPEGLRVATLRTSRGSTEYLVLPQRWLARQDLVEAQQSRLQTHAVMWWSALSALLPAPPVVDTGSGEVASEHTLLRALRSAKAPSFVRIAALEDCAHQGKIALPAPLWEALHTCVNEVLDPRFGSTARILFRDAEFLRARQLQRREHLYRQFAATIAQRFGEVVLEDTNYAKLAELYDASGNKTHAYTAARGNRVRASVSALRLYIEQAVAKHGGTAHRAPSANITRSCSTCGHLNEPGGDDLYFVCDNCATAHDQDINAVQNLLNPPEWAPPERVTSG